MCRYSKHSCSYQKKIGVETEKGMSKPAKFKMRKDNEIWLQNPQWMIQTLHYCVVHLKSLLVTEAMFIQNNFLKYYGRYFCNSRPGS